MVTHKHIQSPFHLTEIYTLAILISYIFTAKGMKSGNSITGKLDYLEESVSVGDVFLSNLACTGDTQKNVKNISISSLFNIQKIARCVVKIKTSNRCCVQCFSSVAN